jgi:hypothetical protein
MPEKTRREAANHGVRYANESTATQDVADPSPGDRVPTPTGVAVGPHHACPTSNGVPRVEALARARGQKQIQFRCDGTPSPVPVSSAIAPDTSLTSTYNSLASDAGPRRAARLTTLRTRTTPCNGIVSTSPTRSFACGLPVGWRLIRIEPCPASSAQSVRARMTRAHQSHLSRRCQSRSSVSAIVRLLCSTPPAPRTARRRLARVP